MGLRKNIGRGLTMLLAGLMLPACLSTDYIPIKYYVVNPTIDIAPAETTTLSLGVHPFAYARRYAKKMVYYDSEFQVGFDDNQQWAELPRDFVTHALLDGFRQSKHFADVSYASDISRPHLIMTGEVRHFDQQRSDSGPWTAYCEVRIELRNRIDNSVEWAQTLDAEIEHVTNDPRGFSAAMSQAIAQIVKEAVAEVTSGG